MSVLGCAWIAATLAAQQPEPQGGDNIARLLKAGQYAEVDAVLAARLSRNPADAEAHYYSGMLPALTGNVERYDAAIAHLKRCTELQPAVSNYHLWLARLNGLKAQHAGVLNALGCVRVVKAEYLKALELDPRNNDARHDLLQYYLQAPGIVGGSVSKARALAADCTTYDANMACALRADVHLHEQEYAAAQQALADIGNSADAATVRYARDLARSLGNAFETQGQAERARQVLEKASSWP
jgi:tetratricopeptide (TPR) repeat protein